MASFSVLPDGSIVVSFENTHESIVLAEADEWGVGPEFPAFHEYHAVTEAIVYGYPVADYVKLLGGPQVNLDDVQRALRQLPAPRWLPDGSEAKTGSQYTLIDGSPIQTLLNDSGSIVVNITEEGHKLFPGYVIRSAFERDGRFYIDTIGIGNGKNFDGFFGDGFTALLNDNVGKILFSDGEAIGEEVAKDLGVILMAGPQCFPAGTAVRLADGHLKAIEAIGIGDMVAAFDASVAEGRSSLVGRPVARLISGLTDHWLVLSNGLIVTSGHHFLDGNGDFRTIGEILADDGIIVGEDGTRTKVSGRYLRYSEETAHLFESAEQYEYDTSGGLAVAPAYRRGWKTYNFEVEDLHTYVAGGVRVHNISAFTASGKDLDIGYYTAKNGDKLYLDRYGQITNLTTGRATSPAILQGRLPTVATLDAIGWHISPSDQYDKASAGKFIQYQTNGTGPAVTLASGTTINAGTKSSPGNGYDYIVNSNGSVTSSSGHTYGVGQLRYNTDTNIWEVLGPNGTAVPATAENTGSHSGGSSGGSTSSSSSQGGKSSQSDHGTPTTSTTSNGTSNTSQGSPSSQTTASSRAKPILIDLDGDGLELTQQTSSNIFYDMAGDGKQHRTAWAGAGDGVLVRDAGNDGLISAKNEVDFTEWDPTATSDMQALRDIFDTNYNNQLDSGDVDWSLFKVMVTNADGTTSLQSLSALGITSINLISNNQEITLPDGSKILGTTTYSKTGGGTGTVADAALSYDSNGFVVTKTVTHNGDGSTTIDNKATNADGSLANETTATTSASGLSVTTKFDDDGDGVFDRVQSRVTVVNGDGSRTETLSRYDGSGTILTSQQITTTSADAKTVSISRDSTGSGTADQTETDVIDSGGAQTVTVTDLNRNASTHDKRITTTSADGLSKTIQTQLTGSGAVNATSTIVTGVAGDGTRTETRTDYAGSGTSTGNRIGSATTVISADGSSRSVTTDVDGDGLADLTVASTIVVNGDGSRATTQTGTNRNSTLRSKVVTLLSADGNTTTVQTDADGDGNYESTSVDAKVLNVDGSTTETVTHKDVNSVTIGKSVSTWSADGKTRTVNVDSDGDGVNDQVETVATVSTNSVDTTSVYSPNGTTLLSKSVATTSADGLTQTTQTDANGDGTYDAVETATTVINVDHSSTLTVITKNGAGTIQIGKTVTTTSADGLSTTTQSYLGTAASPYATVTDVKVLNGDGSITETVTNYESAIGIFVDWNSNPHPQPGDEDYFMATSVVVGRQVSTVSSDRLTTTVASYANASTTPEMTLATTTAADGSKTQIELHYTPNGSKLLSRRSVAVSADALTTTTTLDTNGDGAVDSTHIEATVLNSDGTRTLTSSSYAGSGPAAANLINRSVKTTSGNGLVVTTTVDLDGDGDADRNEIDTTTLNADGSTTRTVQTENGAGTARVSRVATTLSDDGLSTAVSTYIDADGTADLTMTTAVTFASDGSKVETTTNRNALGGIVSQRTTTEASNGQSSNAIDDIDGNGIADAVTTKSIGTDGARIVQTSTYDAYSMLTSRSTTTVSGNGLSTSVATDLDGNGSVDRSTTDVTTINADGSKTDTLSTFGPGGVLKDRTIVTESADGLSTTTQWDTTGTGTYSRSTTDVTVINPDGSKARLVSNMVAGTVHDSVETVTSADGLTVTAKVNTDSDQSIEQTTITVHYADGTVSISAMDGRVQRNAGYDDNRYEVDSADGLTKTIEYDADGNGRSELRTVDAKVLNVDGSTTETVSEFTLTGGAPWPSDPSYVATLRAKAVTSISASGLATDAQFDLNGDGSYDARQTTSVVNNSDASRSETVSMYAGTALQRRTTTTSSADGLSTLVQLDMAGVGTFDQQTSTTRTANADGSHTEASISTLVGGTLLSTTTRTVSADGRTTTVARDPAGTGAVTETRVSKTDVLADGSTVVTTSTFGPSSVLQDRRTLTTSTDQRSTTMETDADGNGTVDRRQITTIAVDGSLTEVTTDYGSTGAIIAKETTTQVFDGLTAYSQTTNAQTDFDGDGIVDQTSTDVVVRGIDGSLVDTLQVFRVSQKNADGTVSTIAPVLAKTVTTTRSANGRTQVSSLDVNGDAVIDETTTATTAIDGSQVTTVTDNAAAQASVSASGDVVWSSAVAVGKLVAASTIISTSSDGLVRSLQADYDGNGTYEHTETWKTRIDGSQLGTIVDRNASGVIIATGTETVSADGLTTTLLEDPTNAGRIDHKEVSVQHADGSKTRTSTDYYANGSVKIVDVFLQSANGQSIRHAVTGGALAEVLLGGGGADTMDGGVGADTMTGGDGNDTYVVDNVGDVVTEAASQGTDLVNSSVTYTLAANVENLTLTGTTAISGTGNASDNFIVGNSGANTLTGNDGNDTLDGGAGADTLVGGNGSDIYIVDNAGDVVTEAGTGVDTVQSSINYTLGANLDNLTLTGTGTLNGTGNSLANIIIGTSGANTLIGGDGNDTLKGGGGSDLLKGGLGNDTYVFNRGDGLETIDGELIAGDVDSLSFGSLIDIDDLRVSLVGNDLQIRFAGREDLPSGFDPSGDVITITNWANTNNRLQSLAFANGFTVQTSAWTGNEATYGSTGPDTLAGTAGADVLIGNGGDDQLDGGIGADSLYGGAGNDTYVVDNAGDVVADNGGGTDSVQASITYTLGATLENLTLTGSSALNGTGNALDNWIIGNTGANILTGSDGNDTLDGGTGADSLVGGNGNDLYIVDNAGDVVNETGTGVDTVQSSLSYTLGTTVENLTLIGSSSIAGTGNALDNLIIGNAGANTLTGGDGNDTLDGGTGADSLVGGNGNDIYIVDNAGDVVDETGTGVDAVQTVLSYTLGANVENLTLTGSSAVNGTGNILNNVIIGNSAANTLTGADGNDTLDGGTGADSLVGGIGNDTYIVDNVGDVVTEAANEGTDLVQSSVTHTLSANVEKLTLTGTAAINGTGNATDNVLTGNAAVNVLTGGDGNDTLDGGAGADTLIGGDGNDTYIVDDLGDVVTESGSGVDTVQSLISYTLGANLENLTLAGGWVAINGTGNAGANALTGNSGDNILDGGEGADTMDGGGGDDTYVVDNVGDVVAENGPGTGGYDDTVISTVTYTLSSGIENLILLGSAAIAGTGNNDNNVLKGNSAANTLTGGSGRDTLDGGAGADTLIGGDNDDVYYVDDVGDVVIEAVATYPENTVRSTVTYTLGANIEALDLLGTAAINGTGNSLANQINGNWAANVLDGGAGADYMEGGDGDDIYVVDNTGDSVIEYANQGIDLERSSVTDYLNDYVENLTLTGTSNINGTGNNLDNIIIGNSGVNVLTGNAGNDTLDGSSGADSLVGGAGNDTYVVDNVGDVITEAGSAGLDLVKSSVTYTVAVNVENLTLTGSTAINGTGNASDNIIIGNSAINVLTGNDGNDTLDGGAGADTLVGGNGNDIYVVDDAGDVVTESGTGVDTVQTGLSYTLGANVENLTLTGGSAVNGTGNTLDNVLVGNSAANTLTGGTGNDTLDGGAGADTLIGGDGSDTYFFGAGWGNDTIGETTGAADVDKLRLVGLNAANVTFGRSGNDLLVTINGTGDVLTVSGHFTDTAHGIEQVVFADSSTMDRTAIAAAAWFRGTSGADTLGTSTTPLSVSGATFALGLGNDSVYSDAANGQSIVFGTGDGADTYRFYSSAASTNVLSLSDLNAADLTLLQSGNDLIVDVNGTSDAITIKNQFNSSNDGINQIRFADTTVWSRTDITSHLTP